MTTETADFLLQLLDSVTISARDPELVQKAQMIEQARTELTAIAGDSQ